MCIRGKAMRVKVKGAIHLIKYVYHDPDTTIIHLYAETYAWVVNYKTIELANEAFENLFTNGYVDITKEDYA